MMHHQRVMPFGVQYKDENLLLIHTEMRYWSVDKCNGVIPLRTYLKQENYYVQRLETKTMELMFRMTTCDEKLEIRYCELTINNL